ncbi:MAG TPA: c-type cytochrome [Pseudolabrys sp.]
MNSIANKGQKFHIRTIAAVLATMSLPALAADLPEWAYPPLPKLIPPDAVVQRQVPGTTKTYTQAQIDDDFNVVDWYPGEHPPLPRVVEHGSPPAVRACARCHLTSGDGHPESSSIAGLPVAYFIQQLAEFKNGNRGNPRAGSMIPIAKAISDEDARAAAEYFSSMKPTKWIRVVEVDTVPKSFVGQGAMRFAVPDGGTEPIGNRIIELPEDTERAESRDPHSGFVAYVPVGTIARGKTLVTATDGNKTVACATCHGPLLKGMDAQPGIAGRAPQYVYRQLNDFKAGRRKGSAAEPMKVVVANLTEDDMVAIAAYLASLNQ